MGNTIWQWLLNEALLYIGECAFHFNILIVFFHAKIDLYQAVLSISGINNNCLM
jgi:hypothetical protein